MRDPRLTGVPDPLLSPLLERLAMLETAKDGLEYQLSDRNFTSEMQNSMLRQKLEQAQAEIARQQEALDNFCTEILAALQERDAAQAAAEESLRTRAAALAQLDAMRLEHEAWAHEKSVIDNAAAMSLAERDRARVESDAMRLKAENEHLARAKAETEASDTRVDRQALLDKIEQGNRAREKLAAELAAVEAKLEAERQASRDQSRSLRDSMNTLQNAAAESSAAAAATPPLPVDGLLDPVWAKVLPTLRRPVAAAFARLRQLPLGAIPVGPRAMIRLAAVSLTQTSDMLKSLEEYFDEGGPAAAPGRAEVPIEAALAAWEGPFRQRRITIVRRVEAGLPQVLVRNESLRVAVFQVLRNVYDALHGGGTLTVHVSRDAASGGVIARFTDTGKGFSPAALQSLFSPFAGARPGHLGLGLCLARTVLRRFGGDIEAVNGSARGAVVTLRLVPPPPPPPAPAA